VDRQGIVAGICICSLSRSRSLARSLPPSLPLFLFFFLTPCDSARASGEAEHRAGGVAARAHEEEGRQDGRAPGSSSSSSRRKGDGGGTRAQPAREGKVGQKRREARGASGHGGAQGEFVTRILSELVRRCRAWRRARVSTCQIWRRCGRNAFLASNRNTVTGVTDMVERKVGPECAER